MLRLLPEALSYYTGRGLVKKFQLCSDEELQKCQKYVTFLFTMTAFFFFLGTRTFEF